MPYPPSPIGPNDTKNETPAHDTHPRLHNELANAVNDIVAVLGDDPAGAAQDVSSRLVTIETTSGGGALDADLVDIATLAPPDDAIVQRKGGHWVASTLQQLIDDIGLVNPPDVTNNYGDATYGQGTYGT